MDKITELRKRAAYLRHRAYSAKDLRVKQHYARDADNSERLADQIQADQDRREELAHGPYLGGTPTGRGT